MKSPRFLFCLIFIFLVMSLVSAQTITKPFNQQFDFKRPCFNNGTFCSSSAQCNITIIYPDGATMINNQIMTFNSSFFNKTVLQSQNNKLGFHDVIMSCCDSNVCGKETPILEITGDGFPNKVFPTQFVIIILAFILVAVGFWFDGLRLFKHLGSILLMIMGILTLYPGYSFINYTTLLGKGLGFLAIGAGFYFLIEDSFSRESQEESYSQFPEGGFEE